MNSTSWLKNLPAMRSEKRAHALRFYELIFGQTTEVRLESHKPFMSLLSSAGRTNFYLCLGFCLMIPAAVFGQTNYYATNGIEYAVMGSALGDQVFPDAAVSTSGGFVVWQDNITDGSGSGISARHVDGTFSGVGGTFRVNVKGTNDQENPHVALLKNGGTAFVWQGGRLGYQHIFGRFMTSSNTWLTTNDVAISAFTNNFQINPALATLNNSNVIVVWASLNQVNSNSLQDVYGQLLSPTGQKVGGEFVINQFVSYNQRTPAVAALKNGGFVVTWVSEQQRGAAPVLGTNTTYVTADTVVTPSVDIYARLYQSNGVAAGNEFLVNSNLNACANPAAAAAADGGFAIAWSMRDQANYTNGWDVAARSFSSAGAGGPVVRLNTYLYGNQYAPQLSSIGREYLAVWTSLGQDGSREGVFGQFFHNDGTLVGREFRVNSNLVSQQMHPVVTSDGASQFLVVWTSYIGSPYNFDLFAQRYADVAAVLQPMGVPFVYAPFNLSNGTYQVQLQVSWPNLLGLAISNYQVYVDGAASPAGTTTGNTWTMTAANGLTASSTHSFQMKYLTTDGRLSPLSPAASGTTWSGFNWGGVPFEWMTQYFGSDTSLWPSASADTDGDGMSNTQEFLAGTGPTNAASVLRVQLNQTSQGMFLNWITQPGLTYQVQFTTNLATWSNLGLPRFAAGTSDSIYCADGAAAYYRVVLLRQ
jgi:hypothetical protein